MPTPSHVVPLPGWAHVARLLRWDWGRPDLSPPTTGPECTPRTGFSSYGCYCGEGTTCTDDNNCPPMDDLDSCCRDHDICYDRCVQLTGRPCTWVDSWNAAPGPLGELGSSPQHRAARVCDFSFCNCVNQLSLTGAAADYRDKIRSFFRCRPQLCPRSTSLCPTQDGWETQCVNLETDSANCGSCLHDCGPGTCTAGRCDCQGGCAEGEHCCPGIFPNDPPYCQLEGVPCAHPCQLGGTVCPGFGCCRPPRRGADGEPVAVEHCCPERGCYPAERPCCPPYLGTGDKRTVECGDARRLNVCCDPETSICDAPNLRCVARPQ
jgi:hypothetical protein